LTALTVAIAPTAGFAASVAVAAPTRAPLVTIDGPSADILGLSGMAIARDGTGGVAYLKNVGGSPRVFVSRLLGGFFERPQQIDATLPGASSQPVIGATNGGVLMIAFINGGTLYVVQTGSSSQGLSAPATFAGNASNPSLQMSTFGKAYLAFTVADGAGHDVRAAYFGRTGWALEAAPLNVTPRDDAGTGAGRPQVGAAGDGVGVVVWGESGHVYSRRIWGTSPSVVTEQADSPPAGCTEQSASSPVVGVQGDSSYAAVAFQATLTCGGRSQQRVLFNRLHGSAYDGITQLDGLSTASADGAVQPQVVTSEYGAGWVISTRDGSNPLDANQLYATQLGNNASARAAVRVDTGRNTASPHAVAATAGLFSNLIAWEQKPEASGLSEIRVRFSPRSGLGSEMVLSSPAQGPTEATAGLAAGGDVNGDGAVAWVQGVPRARAVVVGQLYQPPGGVHALARRTYSRISQPLLSWSPVKEAWRLRYVVAIDGTSLATAPLTSARTPILTDGPHTWQVTASNPAGLTSVSTPAAVFVDTIRPVVSFTVSGTRRINRRLRAVVSAADEPPIGAPATDASGLARVTVNWSDHSLVKLGRSRHRSFHTYARRGRYKITVTATDRAGNVARAVQFVRIKPPPKPKKHRHQRGGHAK
jgi:hypothetical protein